MVRLKGKTDTWIIKHIGNLHSTMVRLKAFLIPFKASTSFYLHSTMVRLKAKIMSFQRWLVYYLHSTMVRLKADDFMKYPEWKEK
ncbi:MAG: hypothetical protein ACRCZ2_02615 [Fusobacteriaceae bacterium]